MMITVGMKVGAMITIGTDTIDMTAKIVDMDTTVMLIITENIHVVIAMYHRLVTTIETIRHMEAGAAIQVDDGRKKSGTGRHDDTTSTINLTMRIVGENVTGVKIRVVEERKIRDITVVTALDHRVANLSL